MNKSFARHPPRLRVGELLSRNQFKIVSAVRFGAAICKAGAGPASTANEDPNITVSVNGNARVIVWIADALLVVYNCWTRDAVCFVIIVRRHDEKMILAALCPAIDKES